MLTDGIQLLDSSTASNFTIANGASLPTIGNNIGELFYLTGTGLHIYDGSSWIEVGKDVVVNSAVVVTALGYTPAALDSSSKVLTSQLPLLAITDTFVVATQAAMLALTAQVGDVAVRTDLNKSFILRVAGASTLANWQELLTPTNTVTSVNGQTGVVTLTSSDVAEGSNLYFTNSRARAAITLTAGSSGATYNTSTGALDLSAITNSAAAANTLIGTTLASNVVSSSLTSVGTLTSLTVNGTATANSFSGSGASLTALNATNISTGTVGTARLGTGTASSTTFLRGDNTWASAVTAVSFSSANGVNGSVSNSTTTPSISISLGAITPTSITSTGFITADSGFKSTGRSTLSDGTFVDPQSGIARGLKVSGGFAVDVISAGIWNGTAIAEINGGTSFTSYVAGDMLYASATNTLAKRSIGTSGQFLTVSSGVPTWTTVAVVNAGTITGATLAANVVSSSLTSVGTLTNFTQSGGSFNVTTATGGGNGDGSNISLIAGNSGTTTGNSGGTVTIQAGTATVTGSIVTNGGDVLINSGGGRQGGTSGGIKLKAGNVINGNSDGGIISLIAGNAVSGLAGSGGDVILTSGNSGNTSTSNSGYITITGGTVSNNAVTPRPVSIQGASHSGTAGTGGSVLISSGTGTTASGYIALNAGAIERFRIDAAGALSFGGGSATTATGTGTTGQVLTSNGAAAPTWATQVTAVTSVNVSGGTTGLVSSGGPITTSGTITLSGTLAIANGGTGATTASAAINALVPAQSGNATKFLTTDGSVVSWGTSAGGSSVLNGTGATSETSTAGTYAGRDSASTPQIIQYTAAASAGNRASRIYVNSSGSIRWDLLADTFSTQTNFLSVARTTSTVTSITLSGNSLIVQGSTTDLAGTSDAALVVKTGGTGSALKRGILLVPSTGSLANDGDRGPAIAWARASSQADGIGSIEVLRTGGYGGRMIFSTEGTSQAEPTERMRINEFGAIGIGGANYGTAGQILTSGGAAAAPTWAAVAVTSNAVTIGTTTNAVTSITGIAGTTPLAFTIAGSAGSGAVVGGNLVLSGGLAGTAVPAGGDVLLQTATTSTGTTLVTRLTVKGTTGALQFNAGWADSSVTTISVNAALANTTRVTLGATNAIAFTNLPTAGMMYTCTLFLTQDATGSRTVTWPTGTKWAGGVTPVLTTTAAKTDIITLTTPDAGTTWYGSVVGLNY